MKSTVQAEERKYDGHFSYILFLIFRLRAGACLRYQQRLQNLLRLEGADVRYSESQYFFFFS